MTTGDVEVGAVAVAGLTIGAVVESWLGFDEMVEREAVGAPAMPPRGFATLLPSPLPPDISWLVAPSVGCCSEAEPAKASRSKKSLLVGLRLPTAAAPLALLAISIGMPPADTEVGAGLPPLLALAWAASSAATLLDRCCRSAIADDAVAVRC